MSLSSEGTVHSVEESDLVGTQRGFCIWSSKERVAYLNVHAMDLLVESERFCVGWGELVVGGMDLLPDFL